MLEFTLLPNMGERDCRNRLQEAYQTLNDLIREGETELIASRFNLCEPLDVNNLDDVASLYELSIRALTDYFETYQ